MEPEQRLMEMGSLVGEPRRLGMLVRLLDGQACPAGELAHHVGIRPSTASHHLDLLVRGGLLTVLTQGRHRYYRLANPAVAAWLEQLAALAPPATPRSLRGATEQRLLAEARTCYDHLAGRLGVLWTRAWVERGWVDETVEGYLVRPAGLAWLCTAGVTTAPTGPLVLGRHEVDWTERVPHFAGPMARAMTRWMLTTGWVVRGPIPRTIQVTNLGWTELGALGVAAPRPT